MNSTALERQKPKPPAPSTPQCIPQGQAEQQREAGGGLLLQSLSPLTGKSLSSEPPPP